MQPLTGPQIPLVEVLAPGLLTTVQDAGRPDAGPLGVPRSGACDPLALAAANLLAGNARDAAALELSLLGPELRLLRSAVVALTGADFQARIAHDSRALLPGNAYALRAGTTISFGAALDGARGYLAVRGGIAVPQVLGSASTSLAGGFGGLDGRALAQGDILSANAGADTDVAADAPTGSAARRARRWPGPGQSSGVPGTDEEVEIRVVRGPQVVGAGTDVWERLTSVAWEVDPRSDRMGVRLFEPGVPTVADALGSLLSTPMTWGAIQVPPGGAPICLLADHPTVGGYPVIAVVASVDRPILGQLRAPHRVRLVPIDMADAQAAFLRSERALDEAARRLRPADPRA